MNRLFNLNMCKKKHSARVYKLVDFLMEKLGITCSIDCLIKLYHYRDQASTLLQSKIRGLSKFVKLEKDIEANIPERTKKVYFSWIDVLASMYTMPKMVDVTESVCPDCGEKLIGLYFSSPPWTWMSLCGCGGYMTICPKCPKQINFIMTKMN